MTVKVIFSLFRIEFHGSQKAFASGHGPDHVVIIEIRVKDIGLTPQFAGGMCI